jgi:hypothetical protein
MSHRQAVFGDDVCDLGAAYQEGPSPPSFDDLLAQAQERNVLQAYGNPDIPEFIIHFNKAMKMQYRSRVKEVSVGVPACVECLEEPEKSTESKPDPSNIQSSPVQPKPQPSTFTYDHLSGKDALRVIELQPSSARDAPLRAALVTHQDRKTATYVALSYTWAGIDGYGSLELTNGVLPITGNLDLALRALRKQDGVLRIWVDAVCINQQDKDEKAVQVSQMGEIYRNAEEILAWLGPETDQTQGAVEYLEELAALSETDKYDAHVRPLALPAMQIVGFPMEFNEARRICETQKTKSLADVYGRKWFTRVWVVQELLLSKRLSLNIGHFQMDYERFRRAIMILNVADNQIERSSWDIPDESARALMFVYFLVSARDQLQQFNSGRVMFQDYTTQTYENVDSFRLWGCKDERDRIYGMMSLFPPDLDLVIVPKYDVEPEHVYTEFARQHLLHEGLSILIFAGLDRRYALDGTTGPSDDVFDLGSLGMLREVPSSENKKEAAEDAVSSQSSHSNLPSWVPEPRAKKARSGRRWTPLSFQAGMPWDCEVALHSKCPHLVALKGFIIDMVAQPLPPELTRDEGRTGTMDIIEALQYLLFVWRYCSEEYERKGGYPTGGSFEVIFKSVVTAGGTLGGLKETADKPKRGGSDWIDRTWEKLSVAFAMSMAGNIEQAVGSLTMETEDVAIFLSCVSYLLRHHEFVITAQNLMGFVPSTPKPGEVIAIICGLASPVVLRPTSFEGQYQLVGPCYLHGIMSGELGEAREKIEPSFLELV